MTFSLEHGSNCFVAPKRFQSFDRLDADEVALFRAHLGEFYRHLFKSHDLGLPLYASKTERARTVPISTAMVELLEGSKADGLASDLHVFARAVRNEFISTSLARVANAAKKAKISYGRF